MVSLEEACSIIQDALPNNRLVKCTETDEYYFFDAPPRRWNGDGSAPAGGSTEYVRKDTGEHNSMHIGEALKIILEGDSKIRDTDMLKYLSEEDAIFAQKILKKGVT